MTPFLSFITFLLIFVHNTYAQSSRVSCGTNEWCYDMDIQPTASGLSQSIIIYSDVAGTTTDHYVSINNNGNDCINPAITVTYEEIDFNSDTEYFNVYDANNNLIEQCQGVSQGACGTWGTCIDESLPIAQIDADDTYLITIQGSDALHALCSSSLSLNVNLTITCNSGTSCGGANTYCHYVDLYPSSGINSVPVFLQSTNADTIEYYEIYITSNGAACNEPYLDIRFQEIDYSAGKPAEYFDVFDQNDSIIVTCEGTQDSQCTWLTCASGLDIGPSAIAADDTYQISIITGYEHDPFCSQNSFTFNAIVNVTCDGTVSPTSPTLEPTTGKPTAQPTELPTIEPTPTPTIEPTPPTTAEPTGNPVTPLPTTPSSCAGTNTYCLFVDVYPSGGINSVPVSLQSTNADTEEFFEVYITSNGAACNEPYLDIIFQEIDYASGKPSEFFDVFDQNDNLIITCEGTRDSQCTWLTCASGLDIGPSSIAAGDTYKITVQTGYEMDPFCSQNSFTFNAIINVTCDSTLSPTSPTTEPTTPDPTSPTFEPTQEPTSPTSDPTARVPGQPYLCAEYDGATTQAFDIDYYSFNLSTITTIEIDSCGSAYDTWLYFQYANGTNIANCDDCGDCGTRTILEVADVKPGRYRIGIGGFSSGFGTYTVDVTCTESITTLTPTSSPTDPTPQPSLAPTIEPTAPTVPTTANPTTQDVCNVSLNVVNDWPISKMNGWTICYDEPYSDATHPVDFSSCSIGDGYYLFVGAKATSTSQTFYVGAYGPSSVINTTTSSNTIAYLPSWYLGYNVYWYYYPPRSFGFAPISTISLSSADTYDTSDIQRLSWHFGQNVGGWRAGDVTGLNSNSVWRKLVYYKACSIAPTPPTTRGPTPIPVTAVPTTPSCAGTNTYCYFVDVYPSIGDNSVLVNLKSTNSDTVEYFEIYITSNGGTCNEPYLDITFQEIDYAGGKNAGEYFDVFDQNNNLIIACEGNQDSQCTWETCATGLDIGPGAIAAGDTYKITVQTGWEMDPFCADNNYAFHANITVTCDSTASPTSPTLQPTTAAPTTAEPTPNPTAITSAPTPHPTTERVLCGTNTWCYYVYLYPSLTRKTSKTVQVYTIVESVQTFHQIEITSIGYDCEDPRIDVIYEEIDFSSSSEYFEVFANDTLIRQCPGTQDQGCGVWNTCIDNYSLPINQMNEDRTYLMEIVGSTGLNDLCIGFGNDYALNVELTITCSISVPKYCDNVDCGWSFLCDEDTQSCVRDCDAFDIDGYLKCSESWAVVDANISSIVDRVGTIDEADESLDDLRAQLDEINEKIERLSRPFREELNGGHANINPFTQEITDDDTLYKYSLLNAFESEDILIVLLLSSDLLLILYALCQKKNKSGVKYSKAIQEKDVEDISESDSEATENEELN